MVRILDESGNGCSSLAKWAKIFALDLMLDGSLKMKFSLPFVDGTTHISSPLVEYNAQNIRHWWTHKVNMWSVDYLELIQWIPVDQQCIFLGSKHLDDLRILKLQYMGGHYSLFVTALAWSSGHWSAFIFKGFSFKDVIHLIVTINMFHYDSSIRFRSYRIPIIQRLDHKHYIFPR